MLIVLTVVTSVGVSLRYLLLRSLIEHLIDSNLYRYRALAALLDLLVLYEGALARSIASKEAALIEDLILSSTS